MTPDQRALFEFRFTQCVGWTADAWERWLRTHYGVRKIIQLTDDQARAALVALRAQIEARQTGRRANTGGN